jgi:cytochrome c oxidase subunit 1
VFVFARGMISGGLAGMPRRTFIAQATYTLPAWHLPGIITAVGGSLMFIGAMLFIFNLIMTVAAGSRTERVPRDVPYSEVFTAPARTGWEVDLDRLRWWVLAAVVLIVIAYAPAFMAQIPPYLVSPGYRIY